jgi:hypothetical protein
MGLSRGLVMEETLLQPEHNHAQCVCYFSCAFPLPSLPQMNCPPTSPPPNTHTPFVHVFG